MELGSQDAPEIDLDAILDGFWSRFGRISEGFWFQFSSQNVHKTKNDSLSSEGERSERASAASEVSGAMELQRHGVNRYVIVSVSFAMEMKRHGVNRCVS